MADAETLPRPAAELTREAWLKAGQALLREAGLRALRLRALTQALNISTGSFYHHFRDFDAFLGQLADYYAGEQLSQNLAAIRTRATSPFERIRQASELALSEDLPRLALAMRAWAHSDPRALAAVRTVDATLMAFFTECLEAMGFSREDAAARGYLLIASGTSDVETPAILGHGRALRDRMLTTLCTPPVR